MKTDNIGKFSERVYKMTRPELQKALIEYDKCYHEVIGKRANEAAQDMEKYLKAQLQDFMRNFNAEKWNEADNNILQIAARADSRCDFTQTRKWWWLEIIQCLPEKLKNKLKKDLSL